MKILCYGDSNTWGWVPGKMGSERFDSDHRWPGVLQTELGSEHTVIEESLGARTTMFDDPREGFPLRNGLALLPITLEIQGPVDVVCLMLGTGDCKPIFDASAEMIAGGLEQLILTVQNFKAINGVKPSQIVVLAPPIIKDTTEFAQKVYPDCTEKTRELIPLYRALANQYDCIFVDSNDFVTVDADEGIHITPESQVALGKGVAVALQKILN